MEIDWNKALTFSLSISAIGVSIFTIFVTRRNLKKQLRLSKLEEILEILHFLNGYYPSLLKVFEGIETSIEKLIGLKSTDAIPPHIIETTKYRNGFIKTIDKETITNKISRLRVLSNAYLKNSKKTDGLKVRIHTVADTYYHMYMFVYMDGDSSIIKKTIDAIIPHPKALEKFINKLENDIIIEMNLGYKSIDSKSQAVYYKTKFQKDLQEMIELSNKEMKDLSN